jgi:hypothetical protein
MILGLFFVLERTWTGDPVCLSVGTDQDFEVNDSSAEDVAAIDDDRLAQLGVVRHYESRFESERPLTNSNRRPLLTMRSWRQLAAGAGNGLQCSGGSYPESESERLRPAATPVLHKGSILLKS